MIEIKISALCLKKDNGNKYKKSFLIVLVTVGVIGVKVVVANVLSPPPKSKKHNINRFLITQIRALIFVLDDWSI